LRGKDQLEPIKHRLEERGTLRDLEGAGGLRCGAIEINCSLGTQQEMGGKPCFRERGVKGGRYITFVTKKAGGMDASSRKKARELILRRTLAEKRAAKWCMSPEFWKSVHQGNGYFETRAWGLGR